ncbi:MAG: SDR family oxidoreductase [Acidobacteria bacterium]|nr:SDR family oxidoreductase [Acidobacteriota bacterium]
MNIAGKVALITGAAKRIGRAIAVELARRGAHIGIHYRSNEADAKETLRLVREAGSDGVIARAELTKVDEVAALVDHVASTLGGIGILINNASVFAPNSPDQTTPADWDAQMDSNAKAPFLVAQHAARHMMKAGHGKIINIADVAGEIVWQNYFPYSISKAALIAVNRGLAKSYAPAIQVNAIAPGPVLFPEYYTEDQKQYAIDRTLLKRAGSPQDIVNAIVFLIENDYITGELLHVDGGRHLAS